MSSSDEWSLTTVESNRKRKKPVQSSAKRLGTSSTSKRPRKDKRPPAPSNPISSPPISSTEAQQNRIAGKESKRLKDRALQLGVLSRERPARTTALANCTDKKALKALSVLDGCDISRPKSAKTRHLIGFPGNITGALSNPMVIGKLADLNTHNPTLYLTFPEGRVKMFGYRQYLESHLLNFESKPKELVCTDQFTELIIFSEYTWIGSEEENPSEKPLSFPVRVLRAVVPSLEVATARPAPLAPKRIAASKPAPTRSSSRAARVSSKKTYVVRGSSESENDSSDSDPSDSENEPIMPMQQIEQNDLVADDVAKVYDTQMPAGSAAPDPSERPNRSSGRARALVSYVNAFDGQDDDDDDDSSPVRRHTAERAIPKRAVPKKHIVSSEDDDDADIVVDRSHDPAESVHSEDSEPVWSPKPTKSSKKSKKSKSSQQRLLSTESRQVAGASPLDTLASSLFN